MTEEVIVFERAKSGRSRCKRCDENIEGGAWRCGLNNFVHGRVIRVWQHPHCFLDGLEICVHEKGAGKCKQMKEKLERGALKLVVRSSKCGKAKCFLSADGIRNTPLKAVLKIAERSHENVPEFSNLSEEKMKEFEYAVTSSQDLEADEEVSNLPVSKRKGDDSRDTEEEKTTKKSKT
jgi:hypothetical protein